jgi:hypothetical protein
MLRKVHTISIEEKAGWAPKLVLTFWRRKSLLPAMKQIKLSFLDHPAHSRITIPTKLYQFIVEIK